jgi:farnesyl-diphosphate farnesyltransferase
LPVRGLRTESPFAIADMGILDYALHLNELRAIVQVSLWGVLYDWNAKRYQYKVWHEPTHPREVSKESDNLKKCYEFLGATSRSFAAVIQELHPKLRNSVTLFYLVLRGLDTIEDDMSIPTAKKQEVLTSFFEKLDTPGWTFHESNFYCICIGAKS